MKFSNVCLVVGAAISIASGNVALAQSQADAEEVRAIVAEAMAEATNRAALLAAGENEAFINRVGLSAAPNPYQSIVSTVTPALVTIKFMMKISSPRGDTERPMEVSGVMISKDGLVLASNWVLNPYAGRAADMSAVPTDLKVLIDDDTEGVPARLIATDKELDLAWVKIDQPAAGGYKALDFAASSTPELGAELVCVDRMGKLVDRAPKLMVGRAAGLTAKPRKLFMTDGLDASYPGTPAFTADGKLVGLVSLQLPDGEFDETVMGELRRLGPVILPAENIVSSTRRVLEQEAERTRSGADAPATPEDQKK